MTSKKVVLLVLAFVVLLLSQVACSDTDVDKIVNDIDNTQFAEDVNNAADDAVDKVEDYVEEMATDAIDMTSKLTEGNLPEVNPETSQDLGEAVIQNLDNVGQIVLDADTAAKELQQCFETCDGNYPDIAGSKVIANVNCIAECKE